MFRAGDPLGPYILISKLGRGSFGVVWLAERRTTITTTRVALKMPLDEDIDLAKIRQEANLWAEASGHPNILPIIEANVYDDQVVIASEYAPDGSFDTWLKRNGGSAPSVEMAVEMASGILAGLQHLHSRHIIHRDLKPDNILLQGQIPRLADFGISRVLKSTSQSSIVAGTPVYMAPEAFDGKRSEQTDLWSVGVIFYEMLAGHLPFPQTDLTSLVGAILTRNPDPLPISVPRPLQEVINRSLAKDIEQRYKSASEMRAALRNAIEIIQRGNYAQRDAELRPTYSPPAQTAEPKKSHAKALVSIFAGLLVAGVIVATEIATHYLNSKEPASSAALSSASGDSTTPEKGGADYGRWLGMLGHAENVPEVIEQTSVELASNPSNALAMRARSAARFLTHAEDAGKRDAAEVERLLANPRSAAEYEARCSARLRLEKLDLALGDCSRAIELDPETPWARFTRGGVYYEKKDYDHSMADYQRGIELNPTFSLAYNNLGIDHYVRRDYNSALIDFNKAIELDPRFGLAFTNRGLVHDAKQEYDIALADYDRGIELDSRSAIAYNIRGSHHYDRRDYNSAISDFNKAVELNPRFAPAYANRGLAHNAKQEYESALGDFNKAIDLDPKNASAYFERGNANYAKQDYNSALADYTKAIQLDPRNAGAYIDRGNIHYARQEYDTAEADYNKAIEVDSKNANAYLCRGSAHYTKQEYAPAIVDYSKAIELNPQFGLAYENRANAYEATGQAQRAATDRQTAQELKK